MVSSAVKNLQFILNQEGANLVEDGIFGVRTSTAVDSLPFPRYIVIALKEVGVRELDGSGDNDRIIEYHKTTSGKYSDDEVAWCGSYVNWVMMKAGYRVTVNVPERAKSWLNFGKEAHTPTVGTIAIKSRNGGGHVCFVIGKEGDNTLICVGGNQSDEVNIRKYHKDDFISFRDALDHYPLKLVNYNLYGRGGTREA